MKIFLIAIFSMTSIAFAGPKPDQMALDAFKKNDAITKHVATLDSIADGKPTVFLLSEMGDGGEIMSEYLVAQPIKAKAGQFNATKLVLAKVSVNARTMDEEGNELSAPIYTVGEVKRVSAQ